ncbi:MAG: tetratricopeptide repeat protein [Candidatus Zixiibacteriota bacterium]
MTDKHKWRNKLEWRTRGPRIPLLFAFLILTLGSTNLAWGQAQNDSLEYFLKRGGNELRSEKYAEAIISYQRALDIDSLNLNALRNLGFTLALGGGHKNAIALWERADRQGIADADIYNNLGVSYGALENAEKSIENFRRALALDQENLEYMRSFGVATLNAGRFEEAHIALEAAVKLAPEDGQINYLLGNSHSGIGKAVKAQRDYRKAIELGYDDAELRLNYGLILDEAGDLWGAEEQLGKAVGMEPDNLDYRQRLAVFYMKTLAYKQAVKLFRENLERDSAFVNSRIGLGAAYSHQGLMDSAYAQLAWVKNAFPNRAGEMMNLIKKAEDVRQQSDSSRSGY